MFCNCFLQNPFISSETLNTIIKVQNIKVMNEPLIKIE